MSEKEYLYERYKNEASQNYNVFGASMSITKSELHER